MASKPLVTYTVSDICRTLQLSPRIVRYAISNGILPAFDVSIKGSGRSNLRVTEANLLKWIAKRAVK
jgi:hypothetical protein